MEKTTEIQYQATPIPTQTQGSISTIKPTQTPKVTSTISKSPKSSKPTEYTSTYDEENDVMHHHYEYSGTGDQSLGKLFLGGSGTGGVITVKSTSTSGKYLVVYLRLMDPGMYGQDNVVVANTKDTEKKIVRISEPNYYYLDVSAGGPWTITADYSN